MRNPLLQKKSDSGVLGRGHLGSLCTVLLQKLSRENRAADPKKAYAECRNRLRAFALGLHAELPPFAKRLRRDVQNARWDIENSYQAAAGGDYALATQWQHWATVKLNQSLRDLNSNKVAYNYDVSGEIGEVWNGSESVADRENQKNIDDTANPAEQHTTPGNPANLSRDFQAERDYPALAGFKNKRVHWPPRPR